MILDRFDIYGIQSYIPHDQLTGGLSGRFRIGLASELNKSLARRTAFSVSGALGLNERASYDIDVFGLMGAKAGYGANRAFFLPDAQLGMIIREIANMKSVVTVDRVLGQIDQNFNDTGYYTINFTQSFYVAPNFTINFGLDRTVNNEYSRDQLMLGGKLIF